MVEIRKANTTCKVMRLQVDTTQSTTDRQCVIMLQLAETYDLVFCVDNHISQMKNCYGQPIKHGSTLANSMYLQQMVIQDLLL
jgi:hypothetical protein